MDVQELQKPIRQVFRRLRVQRFLTSFVWILVGTLFVATVVLGAKRLGQPIPGADWWPFAIAAGVAVLGAIGIAVFSGPTPVDAAVALDRAFELNERLSTALTLPDDLKASPAGKALMADALKHVKDLDVAERFGFRLPDRSWVVLIPGALALVIAFLPIWMPKVIQASPKATAVATAEQKKAVAKQSEALSKKVAEQRKQMDKTKFAEAEKLLAQVEKVANDLAKAPPAEKDKAMVALNKLTDALKERQKQLGSPEQINRQLQQLKEMASNGPGEDFAKALAKGDYQKAASELKQLQQKMANNKMTEKDKQDLQKQLGDMAKQLEKLANLDQRKKQLEEAKKNGGLSEQQFQKEMNKLNDQAESLKSLQKMAQQLAQAQQKMGEGDMQKAAEALGMTQQQLEQMAQQLGEMQSLESALADLQDAKNGMNGGDGLNQLGEAMSQFGQGNRNGNNNNQGLGRGRGQGDRPEAPDGTAAYNTKVKQQFQKGAAVIEGTAPPGQQTKGTSQISIQGEIETSAGMAADALTNQKVPKSVEKHIRGYFDQLNKGGEK